LSTPGIVVAVTAEAGSLVKQPILKGGLIRLPEGAMLTVSGVGPGRAALASRSLVQEGATALVSWGSAGGLSPDLSPGSLILPKIIIASDQSHYPVDAAWHTRLCDRLRGRVRFYTDPLVESVGVVRTPSEKTALFRRTGAVGVDMESAAVASVAREAGVPFIAVRAVADAIDTTIPKCVLDTFDEFGRLSPIKLILGLAEHPAEMLGLLRIGRSYRAAQRTLAAVAGLTENTLFGSWVPTGEGP